MSKSASQMVGEQKETLDALKRVSDTLGVGLSKEDMAILVQLTDMGVNPEGAAMAMKEILEARRKRGNTK